MKNNVKTFQKIMKPLLKANGFKYDKEVHSAAEGEWIIIVKKLSQEDKEKLEAIIEVVVGLLGEDFSIDGGGTVTYDGITVCNYWVDWAQYRFYNY